MTFRTAASRVLHKHRQGERQNVVLFSTARSGSSWLLELIAETPGMLPVDEPLHPRNLSLALGEPADWQHLMPGEQRLQILENYIGKILAGNFLIGVPRFRSRLFRRHTDRIIMKILRCKDLAEWFEAKFDLQVLYLVRHPIPTNLSRKVSPRLELFVQNDWYCKQFLTADQHEFAREVLQSGSLLERNVADWCLQNLPVLRSEHRPNWCVVFYEDLVANTAIELERIGKYLGIEDVSGWLAAADKPSVASAQSDSQTRQLLHKSQGKQRDVEFLVSRWRKDVSEQEEYTVFQILEKFQVDCYEAGNDFPVTGQAIEVDGQLGTEKTL